MVCKCCDTLLATERAYFMAEGMAMARAGSLVSKLESKICYHRDANVDYLEIKTMVDKLIEANKKLKDEKVDFQDVINMVVEDKENLQHDCQGL